MIRVPSLRTITAAALVTALASAFFPAADAADSGFQADALLKRASAAMGADGLKTLQYTGRGMGSSFGQAYKPAMPWPKLNYSRYVRDLDYDNSFIREDITRGRAETTGGGAVPLTGEAPAATAASANHAWNIAGQSAAPRQAAHAGRIHDLLITPHGVIKAAMKAKTQLAFRSEGGRQLAAVSFTQPGIMHATAFLNEDFLVERVESRLSDAVMGDIPVVTSYADYRDYNGVKFPSRIEQKQGGFMTLSLFVSDVKPNAPVNAAVPDNVAKSSERAVAEKAAEGVWFIAGGSHNSVAIEMKDHLVLIESPLSDERAKAVFEVANKLVPGKKVRYAVNSHNHFDHSGGLRGAVAQGATVVAQAQSKSYYERVFANPSRVAPDLLAKSGRKATVVGVGEKMVMKDASRTLELHHIKGSIHADTFLVAYLPKEKLLIEADLFTPGPPNTPVSRPYNALHLNLVENIDRLKLQVDRILPLHGRMVPMAELNRMVGK